MDDKTQQLGQQPQPVSSSQGGTLVQFPTGVQQVASTAVQNPVTQDIPVAGFQKEQEPFSLSKAPSSEFVTPSEQSIELPPDLKEAGVTEVAQVPDISSDLAKAGVKAASDGALPKVSTTPILKTPISEEKAEMITKGSFLFKRPSSSLLWLALVVLRQLRIKKRKEQSSHAD